MNKIKEHAGAEGMLNYHLWLNEQACRQLGHQSVKLGTRVSKFVCIFNAENLSMMTMRLEAGSTSPWTLRARVPPPRSVLPVCDLCCLCAICAARARGVSCFCFFRCYFPLCGPHFPIM